MIFYGVDPFFHVKGRVLKFLRSEMGVGPKTILIMKCFCISPPPPLTSVCERSLIYQYALFYMLLRLSGLMHFEWVWNSPWIFHELACLSWINLDKQTNRPNMLLCCPMHTILISLYVKNFLCLFCIYVYLNLDLLGDQYFCIERALSRIKIEQTKTNNVEGKSSTSYTCIYSML